MKEYHQERTGFPAEDKLLHSGLRGDFDIRNKVLLSVRPDAQTFLQSRLVTRRLSAGQVLYDQGAPVTHAIFPHEGVVSLMSEMRDGRSVEKASIGYEGLIGFTRMMGGGEAFSRSIVQVPGYASWLSIEDLDEAVAAFPCMRDAMLRYAKCLIAQLMVSVACNTLHSAEQRVSRWLLEANDRIIGNTFQVTQEALSQLLGLRRATVNAVCTKLMDEGAIHYSRGELSVLNKPALMKHSCECYDCIRREFEKSANFSFRSSD